MRQDCGLPPQKAYDWNGSFVPTIGEIERRWETLRILIDELTRSAIAPLGGVSLGFVLASTAPGPDCAAA